MNYPGNNSNAGATIISIVVIVGLIIVSAAGRACMVGPEQRRASEKEARTWAHDLGLNVERVVCNDNDSDGDGYVSCTLATKDGATQQVECRGAWSWGHGCRVPKPNLQITK